MRRLGLDRALAFCLGCIFLGWSSVNFPAFWRTADAERMAADIIAGRSFRTDFVGGRLAEAGVGDALGLCRPSAKRAAAVLRLYLYEDAFAAGRMDLADERLGNLDHSLRDALRCIPSDAYLWLLLFSTANSASGFKAENLQFLRMSYMLGPHEGWISLKRNPVALAVLSALDPELSRAALDEFAALVENGLYDEAAAIFANTNPAIRERLLNSLADLPEANRRLFSKALDTRIPFVKVPGIVREDERPWKN